MDHTILSARDLNLYYGENHALKNIMIPRFEQTVKFITDALEEKEREEFSRLKVIKSQKAERSEIA